MHKAKTCPLSGQLIVLRISDNHSVLHPKPFSPQDERFRIWLSMGYILRGDDSIKVHPQRRISCAENPFNETPGSRSHESHGVTSVKGVKGFVHPGKDANKMEVSGSVLPLELPDSLKGDIVEIGIEGANYIHKAFPDLFSEQLFDSWAARNV